MAVEYREIVGFPGYRVGNDGSVWTRWQLAGFGYGGGCQAVLGDTWKRMKPQRNNKHGHLAVTLFPGKKRRAIHLLVLEAFVGPCPPGMECRHFPDRDPANNSVGNLSWDTRKTNQSDKKIHGTACKGERHHSARLTPVKVLEVRARCAAGERQTSVAASLGISQAAVSYIIRGRNWAHVA